MDIGVCGLVLDIREVLKAELRRLPPPSGAVVQRNDRFEPLDKGHRIDANVYANIKGRSDQLMHTGMRLPNLSEQFPISLIFGFYRVVGLDGVSELFPGNNRLHVLKELLLPCLLAELLKAVGQGLLLHTWRTQLWSVRCTIIAQVTNKSEMP